MVRREIRAFTAETSLGAVTLDAPFSIASAIASGKLSEAEKEGVIAFSADVYADSVALSIKNIYVKLGRFSAPCDVFINETKIGHVDGERLSYLFSASSALVEGNNKLTLEFNDGDRETIGVFAPIEIVRFNNAIIDKISVSQKHDGGAVTVGIRLDMIGNTENVRAVATLTSSAGQMYYAGLTKGRGSITIPDPLYWWPHGHGVQNLYKLTVNLYGETDIEDTVETRIGLRTAETSRSVDGSSITVNGVTVLPMGAIFRAQKDLSSPTLERLTEAFITYAAMANYNTLVIPKDSPRPTERFYDLCDIHGIMVIEEVDGLSDGYVDTLERVTLHPSLVLLDVADCESIEAVAEKLNLAVPELGFSIVDSFASYPSHPSLPHIKALESAVSPAERNPTSLEMEKLSDKETTGRILLGILEKYPYPSSLEDLSYLSQLAAANAISKSIKELRLAEGASGRAVFDGLGDLSTAASSAAIDSTAHRKALQLYSHKFFAPIALYADNDEGKILFSISSQRKLDFSGTIEYRIADAKNVTVYKNSEPIEFDGMTAKKLFTRDLSEYIKGHEREYYLEYSLREGSSTVFTDVLLFVPEKHFAFEDPHIECEIAGSDKRFSMTVTAKSFAKDVVLDFDGAEAVFSDNYLNVTSSSPIKITLNVTSGIEASLHLKNALKVRSVYDSKKFN